MTPTPKMIEAAYNAYRVKFRLMAHHLEKPEEDFKTSEAYAQHIKAIHCRILKFAISEALRAQEEQ